MTEEATTTPALSFWAKTWASIKSAFSWIGPKTIGPILVVVVVIVAVILVAIGFKELQIGGLLGKLLGKKVTGRAIDVANSVDPDRVDANGKLILPGQPDSTGQTQAVVVPIQDPGLFSDPKTVTFVEPGKTEPTEVHLPDGVTNKDVSQVVLVQPDIKVVTVKDSSKVSAQTVDDLLKKYGK